METKTCRQCKEDKTLDLFPRNGKWADGLRTICKACANENTLAYKRKQRAEQNTAMRKPYTGPNKESLFDRETYVPPRWGR